MNVLIISELCISVLLAAKEPETFTVSFFKYFFIMVIPTIIMGIVVIRLLGPKVAQRGMPEHLTEEDKLKVEKAREAAALAGRKKASAVSAEMPAMLIKAHDTFTQLSKWRSFAQKTTALFFVIVALSLLDSCQAKFRTPFNVFNVMPGSTLEIAGALEKKVPIEELTYKSASERIQLSFSEVRTGIWMGGAMWIGHLTVSPDISPGEYRLIVFPVGYKLTPEKPVPILLINVHQDYSRLRQSFKSFIQRGSGINPWWIVIFCLPCIGFSLGTTFYLSRKLEYLLAQEGKAEVFKVSARIEGYEIIFGLGTKHGVRPGDALSLFDSSGRYAGSVTVQKVGEGDSVALAEFDSRVMTGYIVSQNTR